MIVHQQMVAIALNREQSQHTCGPYKFLVKVNGWQSHKGFRRCASLVRWAEERGLDLTVPTPLEMDEGDHGRYNWTRIGGQYGLLLHLSMDEFYALPNVAVRTRTLSSGDWVEALITQEADMRVVHVLNPNVCDRKVFDRRESDAEMG